MVDYTECDLLYSYLYLFVMQVCIGNLDLNVTEEELKQTFMQFGDIVSVKIYAGKGYGYVQFGTRFCFLPLNFNMWIFMGLL